MEPTTSIGTEGSVHLHISELNRKLSKTGSSSPVQGTNLEPQSSIETENTNSTGDSIRTARKVPGIRAPEKKLTLFALRLAVLEKAATGLGTLGFIWATVVLLGGFAITLDRTDFWFITTILLIESTRIFSRSHELEWQHQSIWSISLVGISSFRAIKSSSHFVVKVVKRIFRPIAALGNPNRGESREISQNAIQAKRKNFQQQRMPTRTWITSEVPLVPYSGWMFISRNVSKVLYGLQLASATACVVLSLMKLIKQNFGELEKGDSDKRNRKAALLIFYSLALSEALLFLLEKAYWEWNVIFCKILDKVTNECELGTSPSGMVATRRFFYDAYSLCVNGSIFDGLKMDMVSFAMDLLASNFPEEQLMGAQILQTFAASKRFSDDTLQKIGINLSVMERLVEMLNWKDPQEEQIRKSAAEIVAQLAGKKQNSLRVAGIPGAMESIASLLHISRSVGDAADEIPEKKIIFDDENYSYWTFNHLGLTILKKLARDHDNCGKIGNTRGLLPKIIDCTHAGHRLLTHEAASSSQIQTVKRSLQVVKMLASTTGSTGKQLRKEISEIVFTISNIRDILRYGDRHPQLQKLGIEILRNLAIEEDATEIIGGTGGVLKELFNIFFKETIDEKHKEVKVAAGAALAMLAFESECNCIRILKLNVNEKLVEALEDPILRINAARILRNLCAFSGDDCFDQLKDITAAGPTVLREIMTEEMKLQEVMIGLGARVFAFMTSRQSSVMFQKAGITEVQMANKLVQLLKAYPYPSIKVPRMRRFVLELAIWMMKDKKQNIRIFRNLGMQMQLEYMLDTISDIESFNIFSGTVGLSRHRTTVHSLVESAMQLLADG
ncbi:OLC1v1020218C1 [Oldenlandia corymbosa var. corymbosa]|uniref:OLC1v1020218C1 n=1 Tax=Oldenlandia corymbosa var. corymbosa TaxID=529605 RepID=A0AAV1EFU5_OLDCO|nr:OLC1v1020218C1 [Oldenlandia corymbosa var. corymbosa]